MSMHSITRTSLLAGLVAAAALSAPNAARADQYLQNGSGLCKSALPVYDGNIRNRPQSIGNEGTANAYVSCSTLDHQGGANSVAGVWLHNTTGAAVDVNCTMSTQNLADGAAYFSKTGNVPAGGNNYLLWTTADNGGNNFSKQPNFSCLLPPGVQLWFVTYQTTTNL